MRRQEIAALMRRRLDSEPGVIVDEREEGTCFLWQGRPGDGQGTLLLFAAVADGGLLLALDEEERKGVIRRKVGRPNTVLPKWVAQRSGRCATDGWVWIPVSDPETFERRLPHVVQALEYCRYLHKEPDQDPRGP